MSNYSTIILFDGVCNLCNGFVQFVIKHDTKKQFSFGSLQSKSAIELLVKHNVSTDLKTVILIVNNSVYYKSDAALRVLRLLRMPYSWLYVFIVLPTFIRNIVYDFIAKHRYKLFGKKDSCMVPSNELKNRFIE